MSVEQPPIPRLPVLGWASFKGKAAAPVPGMLDLPNRHFTTSGRASILLALELLGVKAGDRVLLPTYHCPTMVAPVAHLGAEPVFYPIDAKGTPDFNWLAQQDLTGVRVLLAAHFFGLPQPMERIRAWCDERGIALIEDCAHALFGTSGGKPIGSWGDMAIGSLTKFLPVPLGGCLVVNRPAPDLRLKSPGRLASLKILVDVLEVAAKHQRLKGLNGLITGTMSFLRSLRRKSREVAVSSFAIGLLNDGDSREDQQTLDGGLARQRLAKAACAISLWLPRSRNVARRRRCYEVLAARLSGIPGMHPLMPKLPDGTAPYVFPLWVDKPDPGYATLRELNMPVSRWNWLWPDVPELPGDQGLMWSHHVLQIACHQDLTRSDIERAVALLRSQYFETP